MKVLELFSGLECISNAFRARGHECFTVDWDEKFPSSLHIDIMDLTSEIVLEKFGHPETIVFPQGILCGLLKGIKILRMYSAMIMCLHIQENTKKS